MPQPTKPNLGVGIEGVSRAPSTIEPEDSKEKDIRTFLNEISTEIKNLSINLRDLSDRGERVKLLSTYIFWLRRLSSLTEEILKSVSPKQSEIEDLNSDINKLLLFLDSMLSQSLKFQTTRDHWFPPRPEDLATANRLDPYGRYIDLEAVTGLYWLKFSLDTRSQIEKIANQLIEIIGEKSNTSPEQSQVESGLSDEQLQEELKKFNQELGETNKAADTEILKGIVDSLFRYKIKVGTEELTIMELVSKLLSGIQTSVKNKEDEKILQALEIVKGDQNLYSKLRDYFISHRIPISFSISSENMQKYLELFNRLYNNNKLTGKKVKIVLRDTSKLFYLKALLEKINKQEQEILDILKGSFKKRGQELNIDVFTNALRFLIQIIETDDTSEKSSARVKKGVVSFEEEKMKPRRAETRRGDATDTILTMVVTEAQGRNRNPEVCEFIPYPQYMLSLFDIGEISLVGE